MYLRIIRLDIIIYVRDSLCMLLRRRYRHYRRCRCRCHCLLYFLVFLFLLLKINACYSSDLD